MGYLAPIGAIDVSNAIPRGHSIRPTLSEPATIAPWSKSRRSGIFIFTLTNAYSGNNGRAAILNNTSGANLFYTAGNAGNGSNPQPAGIILGAGAQILTPAATSEAAQSPGIPTPVASFNVTQLGDKADKIGKDTNFRGLTIFNNVLYYTKGSGSNGINTVYFVDTTGTVCTDANGVGLPVSGGRTSDLAVGLQPSGPPDEGSGSQQYVRPEGLPYTHRQIVLGRQLPLWRLVCELHHTLCRR